MKALCLSGGGSKGAFVGGMLEYMKLVLKKDYDLYLGTSTGTLLQTLTSLNMFNRLKEAYTSISLSDIYKTSPFKPSKDPENPKINLIGILKMLFIEKKSTFGDSSGLKNLIYNFYPKNLYERTIKNNKNLIVAVSNMDTAKTELYSSKELGINGYDDFVFWTWVSCNAVPFTSLVKRNGYHYADGGFTEHVPIRRAIELGATEIDVITTKPFKYNPIKNNIDRNPLSLIERMVDVMLWESAERDIEVVKKMSLEKDVKLNIYYMPRTLTDNSMYFDKNVMSSWWDEGYKHAKQLFNDKDKKLSKKCCHVHKFKKSKRKPKK